jgi:Holliday junction resolvasome RuvABC endonuclease subunit
VSIQDLKTVDYVLGIDLGSYRTGLAAIEVGKEARLVNRARVVVEGKDYVDRWAKTIVQIEKFMTEFLMGRPVAIAIEQPNSGRNMQSTRELTGGFGAVLYWLHQNGMSAIDVNTSHAKKVFCGKGGGGKQQTIDRANELYGLELKYHSNPEKTDDDVADAIQVAYTLRVELIEADEWFRERSERDA